MTKTIWFGDWKSSSVVTVTKGLPGYVWKTVADPTPVPPMQVWMIPPTMSLLDALKGDPS